MLRQPLATDASGTVVPNSRQWYDAWGNLRVKGTGLPTDVGYTGQRLDATGLMYYRARYYAQGLGRFISADSIVPGASDGSGGGAGASGSWEMDERDRVLAVERTGEGECN